MLVCVFAGNFAYIPQARAVKTSDMAPGIGVLMLTTLSGYKFVKNLERLDVLSNGRQAR